MVTVVPLCPFFVSGTFAFWTERLFLPFSVHMPPKDVIVLGLGISERPGIASAYLEREGHDRDSIDLPKAQKDFAKKIIALGKPTVIFLLNGGGLAIVFVFVDGEFFWWGDGRAHRLVLVEKAQGT